MAKQSIQCRRSSPNCAERDSGFTLLELLVASFLGLTVVAMSLSSVLSNRNLYKRDIVRTRINQNLRSAIDIIGMNVRQAGEALPRFFPAVELVHGTGSDQDTLILRRNLFENEIFNLCSAADIQDGSSTPAILVAYDTSDIACSFDSAAPAAYLTAWDNYRLKQGGTARAYMYDRSLQHGEFFVFTGTDTDVAAKQITIRRNNSAWKYDYTTGGLSTALYLVEEYKFRVLNGTLQLIENDDTSNILNVVDGINWFRIRINMTDGTVQDAFTPASDWTAIKSLEITAGGSATYAGKTIADKLTVTLYPRNILSNQEP